MKEILKVFGIVALGLFGGEVYTAYCETLTAPILIAPTQIGGTINGATIINASGVGNGTVTSVSVTAASGVSGTVANPTTTPAITLTLGNISPTSVAASGTVTGSNLSGTNTGDQTITLTGGVTGSGTGSFATTVQSVGGASSAVVATGVAAANAATSANTPSTIVARDTSGNFSASTITATTQATYDNSTNVATTAYATALSQYAMSTMPLNLGATGGGTYSFGSLGTGASVVVHTTGGVVDSISSVNAAGSGYAVGDLLLVRNGNHDAVLRVATLSGSGVATVTILNGGTSYTNGSTGTLDAASSVPYTFTLTGTLTSNATFIMTNGTLLTQSNQWLVNNNTTGAFTVTFKISNGSDAPTGTGVIIPQGTSSSAGLLIQTDGSTDIWPMAHPAGTLSIANGGTNNTSFIAPSNNCNAIPWFDGTKLTTNSLAYDICYDAANDSIGMGTSWAAPRAKLDIVGTSTNTAFFTNTGAQSSTGGAGMIGYADPTAAITSGSRLGFYLLGGAVDGAHTVANSAGFQATATENFSGTNQGANLCVLTTPNGSTAATGRRCVGTWGQDASLAVLGTATFNVGSAIGSTTGLLVNPSSASGNLVDFQLNGTSKFKVDTGGNILFGNTTQILGNSGYYFGTASLGALLAPSTAATGFNVSKTDTNTSGTSYAFKIQPTYNQISGTAANTDLLINRTQTAIGSGAQLLLDAQVGGVSKGSLSNTGAMSVTGSYGMSGNVFASATAPTIASACGTTPAISANGTSNFDITIGTGGTASTCVLTMPAATTAWSCLSQTFNPSATQAALEVRVTARSTTSITLTNLNSAAVATAFDAGQVISVICGAH